MGLRRSHRVRNFTDLGGVRAYFRLIFALLKAMYGDEQYNTLADAIQAALMLRKHDSRVG